MECIERWTDNGSELDAGQRRYRLADGSVALVELVRVGDLVNDHIPMQARGHVDHGELGRIDLPPMAVSIQMARLSTDPESTMARIEDSRLDRAAEALESLVREREALSQYRTVT